jgi:hypothetical protein
MADGTHAASSSEGVERIERIFVDDDGVRWRVFEQAFGAYDRRSGQSLIFASDAAVRRVRTYPGNWATMPDAELMALSWTA